MLVVLRLPVPMRAEALYGQSGEGTRIEWAFLEPNRGKAGPSGTARVGAAR